MASFPVCSVLLVVILFVRESVQDATAASFAKVKSDWDSLLAKPWAGVTSDNGFADKWSAPPAKDRRTMVISLALNDAGAAIQIPDNCKSLWAGLKTKDGANALIVKPVCMDCYLSSSLKNKVAVTTATAGTIAGKSGILVFQKCAPGKPDAAAQALMLADAALPKVADPDSPELSTEMDHTSLWDGKTCDYKCGWSNCGDIGFYELKP